MIEEPNFIEIISNKLNLNLKQVGNTLKLIEEDATTPFIARYRKESTGNLDENQIRKIIEIKKYQEKLFNLKKTVLNSINEQKKLTKEIKENIIRAKIIQEVEDIYEPYKRTKKTKADIAKERGFQIIAKQILNQKEIKIPQSLLDKYSQEEILSGAQDIIAQDIAEDIKYKESLRFYYNKYGEIESKYKTKLDDLNEKDKKQIYKFEIYDNFISEIKKIKSYQILALNRGENLKILNVKLINDEIALDNLIENIRNLNSNDFLLIPAIKEGYKKLFKSIETEIRNNLTKKAHIDSITTFQNNLKELLLTKPNYNKEILAIDPGFRTGCKIAILNKYGEPKEYNKIFLEKEKDTIKIIKDLIEKHKSEIIVIGNGTGSNECFEILSKEIDLPYVIVNESGASVYSASKVGAEEFPDIDLTNRGTISIGRRFIDPLSELIKIPVESIGVGMYQHDINQKELSQKLSFVVEDVVHSIGINLNTASKYLLENISGLTSKSAQKIINNKPYKSREELKKILTPKAYEYSIGFLRIPESKEELDNTSIHPKDYIVAKKIINGDIKSYNSNLNIDENTFNFIIESYSKKGFDPRIYEANFQIKKTKKIEDLKEEDIIEGIVRNIMQFGAFVDIGLKNDGLIHISEIANSYVDDVNKFLKIGQKVKVKIISIDLEKGKIQLSLKQVDTN